MKGYIGFTDVCQVRDFSRVKSETTSPWEVELPEEEIDRMEKVISDFWALQTELDRLITRAKEQNR